MAIGSTPTMTRRGARGIQDINPMDIVIDVDSVLSRAPKAESAFTELIKVMQKGAKNVSATQDKIWMRQQYDSDTYDDITNVVLGTSGNNETRFANLAVACRNVLSPAGNFFYKVGEDVYLSNGQTGIIVATPDAIHPSIGTLTTDLTLNSTTRTAAGTIVVMNVEKAPFAAFPHGTTGGLHWGGKTVGEGESVSASPIQQDVLYDMNLVETFETTLEVTREELHHVKSRGAGTTGAVGADYKFQNEHMAYRILKQRDLRLFFGNRTYDSLGNRKVARMGGLNYFVRSNVMLWNPWTTTDIEKVFNTWMLEHLFRYNPGKPEKVVFIGQRLHAKWQEQYRDMRRIDARQSGPLQAMGIEFDTYKFSGNTIRLIPYQNFGLGTAWEWWAFGVDLPSLSYYERFGPTEIDYTLPGERMKKVALEMACTMAVRNEMAHAILRPY